MTDTASTTSPPPGTASAPNSSAHIGAEQHTGAAAMYANDMASQHLGITLDAHAEGTATCSMTVTETMVNGHGITHGGYIFLFADTTFAMACNSVGSVTVASGGDITFLKPSRTGDVLTARGRRVAATGRSGIYDVEVLRGEELIAVYRGRSRTLPAPGGGDRPPASPPAPGAARPTDASHPAEAPHPTDAPSPKEA